MRGRGRLIHLVWLIPLLLFTFDVVLPFGEVSASDDKSGKREIERTILISLDSCSAEVFNAYLPETKAYFERNGTIVEEVQSCVAAETMSGHSVMLTGATSGSTGILGNGLFDIETGRDIAVVQDPEYRNRQTIFEYLAAIDFEGTTAFISGKWRLPRFLSQGADIVVSSPASGFRIPEAYRSGAGRPITHFEGDAYDLWTARVLTEVVRRDDPAFIFVNFAWLDRAGHDTGNLSFNRRRMARMLDSLFIQLITDLRHLKKLDSTLLLVTADHGMDSVYGYMDPAAFLEASRIPVRHIHPEGHCAFIYLEDPEESLRAADLLRKHPEVEEVLTYQEMDRYSFQAERSRTGDLWLSLKQNRTVNFSGLPVIYLGMHGGLATRDVPFAAAGPGIPSGRSIKGQGYGLEDIVPTLLHLWGVEIPDYIEGEVIGDLSP